MFNIFFTRTEGHATDVVKLKYTQQAYSYIL